MTVSEMIAELEKLPGDLPISIEGYQAHTEEPGCEYIPQSVEGLQNGEGRKVVVIWASLGHVEPVLLAE